MEETNDVHHIENAPHPITYPTDEKAWAATTEQAKEASAAEHNMSFKQAVAAYPGAVLWSILVSTAIIMEGYDLVLIRSLFGQDALQKRYGNYYGDDIGYQLSGPWQVGLTQATIVGPILGAFLNGWLTTKYGYRRVLRVSLFSMIGFIFLPFFAPSLGVLCAGQFLCGIP